MESQKLAGAFPSSRRVMKQSRFSSRWGAIGSVGGMAESRVRLRSGAPLQGSTGRSTVCRSSFTRSKSGGCYTVTAENQPMSSRPGCSMMSWRRPQTPARELELEFGSHIALLVAAVSDDPSIKAYEDRKRELRDRVERSGPETLAIYAADKIAKVRELGLLSTWRASQRQNQAKLGHYRASLEMLRRAAGYTGLVILPRGRAGTPRLLELGPVLRASELPHGASPPFKPGPAQLLRPATSGRLLTATGEPAPELGGVIRGLGRPV